MSRCAATLFVFPHAEMMAQKRDAAGALVVPHTLVWQCLRCGRPLGETTLFPIVRRPAPRARLLERLRRLLMTKGDYADVA